MAKKIGGKLRDVLEMRITELMSDHRINQTRAQRLLAESLATSTVGNILFEEAGRIADGFPHCMDSENFDSMPTYSATLPTDSATSLEEYAAIGERHLNRFAA